jgi:hypothetical protein
MRLSEALKDVKQGVDVIQSTLVQRDDPLRVHADIGEARSSPPGQRWRPRDGEHYFLIQGHGRIAIVPWNDTAFDHETWHFGNCFQTYAHAKQARQQLKALLHTFHHEHP